MKQAYVVLKQEYGFSKHAGTPYTKITLVGTKDRKEYVTYVDKPNRNSRNWEHITRHPQRGYVLRNLKVKTHKDKLLIDADSDPIIEVEDDDDQRILDMLKEVWTEQDLKNDSDRFTDLFE